MLNSNQGRKWQKYVKIKTIRAGIDMGVSPRLRHKFSCINAWSSYFESDARSLSAPWAIYSIFIVNSLQTQAFFRSCGGKPRLEKRLRLIHSLLWVLRLTSPLVWLSGEQCCEEVPWRVQRVSMLVPTIVVNLWPRSHVPCFFWKRIYIKYSESSLDGHSHKQTALLTGAFTKSRFNSHTNRLYFHISLSEQFPHIGGSGHFKGLGIRV